MKLDSRYNLETGVPDGYQLEDGSGVYILEQDGPFIPTGGDEVPQRAAWMRNQTGSAQVAVNLLITTLSTVALLRAPVFSKPQGPRLVCPDPTINLLTTTLAPAATVPVRPQDFQAWSRHPLSPTLEPNINVLTGVLQPLPPGQSGVEGPGARRNVRPLDPPVSPQALVLTPAQPIIAFQPMLEGPPARVHGLPVDGNLNLLETTLAPVGGRPFTPVLWELPPRLQRDDRQRGYLEYLVLDDTNPFTPVVWDGPAPARTRSTVPVQPSNLLTSTLFAPPAPPVAPITWPSPVRALVLIRGSADPILGLLETTLKPVLPTVTVQATTGAVGTSATGNGTITATGGDFETDRGFVYDTASHADPGNVAPGASGYASNVMASAGPYGVGAFSLSLTGLTPGLTYFVRAFARNSVGYDYSNSEDSFVADSGGAASPLLPFWWRRRGRR